MNISAFFPAFNEEGNIEGAVRAAIDVLSTRCERFEVIIVDDGSRDGTAEVAARLAASDERVRLVRHAANRGYGAALRTGFAAARYDWIFFSDADLQFDLREIDRLLPAAATSDFVIGYRIKRRDPFPRRLNAVLWNRLVRRWFGVRARDIDCAFKMMRRSVVATLPLQSEGAFLSTELLCRAAAVGARITQVGVTHYPRQWGEQTGANLRVVLRAFRELWRLRRALR
ncbi:MAG: glycosyltransferase family 2 protein [Armatimonadetes bacterium]|nr:glycosyltransferase family 2 protein [Armatimonadota bacterium]